MDGAPGAERRTTLKDPEPYVPSETHILKKYRGNPPSLVIHLHATHFRFDQQDGSFSYQSEMRVFIEHLQKKTIPHDMLEEFRKSGVKFYDGWLIVKVVDHKSVAKAAATTGAEAEDDKPFSIHNYNTFITPSPYVPYPQQQSTNKSPVMKQESGVVSDKQTNGDHPSSSTLGEPGSEDAARPSSKPGKPQPRIYHIALRPTNLSKHMDLVLASMELDPKSSLNRKQSQVFNARTPGSAGAMAAPLSLDTSAAGDKGSASKKRKLRIAPDQMINFERSVVNHTAPPLCLDLVNSLEEAEAQMLSLRDPLYDQQPPSPKSRKRTVAELAADDALAKEQERFMLIMAGDGGGAGANTGVVDGQAAGAMFQPDFGKFNTIQQIKFQTAEKQKREEERRMHDDANKRQQEEERKRHQEVMRLQQQQAHQQQAERNRLAQLQEQKRVAVQAAAAQQQQQQLQMQQQIQAQQQQQAQQNAQQMAQLSGVPPNMHNQIRQGQPMSSPVMRQSTPHGNSSPIVNNGQAQAVPMATQSSQQGMAGSPARPGSAMQHGHPGVAMARGPSNQGPSRNGTPQISHNTPAMPQATPVMRQGTPAQRMSQASPHPGMMAPTPQMQQAQMMAPGQQMQNGMHYPQTAQQLAMQQQRHHAMQQAAMQQGMMAGNPVMAQAQMAHMQAQRHANADQQAAILQQRQRQVAAAHQAQLQQAQQQQIGTPQQTAPSPANSAQHAQNQYSQNLRNQLQNQMQQVANHGSPVPQGQPTPQQQMAQLQRQQQAAQAGQMNPQMGQPGMQMSPQQQQMMRNAQMQQMQQAQFNQMNPQQQQQMQQMMMQQQQQRQAGQMSPQQMAAMQQQQRTAYPPQIQANMAKIRDQRVIHHTNKLANDRYQGNMQMIQPQEHQDIKRMAIQDAQTWARKWQANQAGQRAAMMQQHAQAQAQAQQAGMGQMPQ